MAKRSLEDKIYPEDWSDKWEPWASAVGTGADVAALYALASGVGAEAAPIIAVAGNVPNVAIDLWQAGRGAIRSIRDGGWSNIGDALWNTAELGLDFAGTKLGGKILGRATDKQLATEMKHAYNKVANSVRGQRAADKLITKLRKKGVTQEEINKAVALKLSNIADNTTDVINAKRRVKEQTKRNRTLAPIIGQTLNNVGHVSYYGINGDYGKFENGVYKFPNK